MITAAVLGCGSIGSRHVRNLSDMVSVRIVAFDTNPEASRALHGTPGVSVVEDLDLVWELNPDIALVCTPTNFHVEFALAAAKHGCHLFIEKPLSHSWDGVAELSEEVEQRGLVTLVGCNMRFHPGPAQVKSCLHEGQIGDVLGARIMTGSYLPRWRPQQDFRQSYSASVEWGGAVLDCIHEIDLVLWLLGEGKVVASVTKSASSLGLQTDGLAEIILEHTSGAISNLHLNFVQRNYQKSILIIGSQGTIDWDFNDGRTRVYGPDGELVKCFDQPQGWDVNQMYVDEMNYFLDCVARTTTTTNRVDQAMKTLQIAIQAREMGWTK